MPAGTKMAQQASKVTKSEQRLVFAVFGLLGKEVIDRRLAHTPKSAIHCGKSATAPPRVVSTSSCSCSRSHLSPWPSWETPAERAWPGGQSTAYNLCLPRNFALFLGHSRYPCCSGSRMSVTLGSRWNYYALSVRPEVNRELEEADAEWKSVPDSENDQRPVWISKGSDWELFEGLTLNSKAYSARQHLRTINKFGKIWKLLRNHYYYLYYQRL